MIGNWIIAGKNLKLFNKKEFSSNIKNRTDNDRS